MKKTYKQGKIVDALCRFSKEKEDSEEEAKYRPVVILADLEDDVWVCEITSTIRENDKEIPLLDSDFSYGQLPKKSCIKPGKIQTVSKENIRKEYGQLRRKKTEAIIEKIQDILRKETEVKETSRPKALQRPSKPK